MDTVENLTNDWLDQFGTLEIPNQITLPEAIVRPVERRLKNGIPVPGEILVWEQRGWCKLSDATRKAELARMIPKKQRKKYTRRRGTVHPKKKEATLRRTRAKNWATNPLACILYRNRYKCKRIDRTLWTRYASPLWVKYDPSYLTVEFPATAGTRAVPWTMYNMVIKYRGEVVYNGPDQELYDLSMPKMNESLTKESDELNLSLGSVV